MLLARAIGYATATVRHPSLAGAKLLLVQAQRSLTLEPVLALDRLGAGPGDLVLITSDGQFARDTLADKTSPARWSVVGIVDSDEQGPRPLAPKSAEDVPA
ncbi:MAG: EutN/CcmL family microcompartment protein [Planctomycetota bacterium]